jgi:nucleoside-diphosphate-sugar epimerase
MKTLITGISGFIGNHIKHRLEKASIDVIGTGRAGALPGLAQDKYRSANLCVETDCLKITEGIDTIIHCAGKAGAWGNYSDYEAANVLSTDQLLKASQKNGVSRFINLSSPSIYFAYRDQWNLKETDLPKRFSNAYAETKFLAEELVKKAHSQSFSTVSLRPRGVIGRGDRNWLPRIVDMRESNQLIQPGNGKNVVDFTSIDNLVDAVELCIKAPSEKLGGVYNITNGNPEKLWEVIDFALAQVGLDGKRRRIPLFVAMGLAKASECFHKLKHTPEEPDLLPIKVGVAAYSMTLDITKAKKELGYVPRVSTKDAILDFAKHWKRS